MNDHRVPVWSVASGTAWAYFALFAGQVVVGVWLAVDAGWEPGDSVSANLLRIWERVGSMVLASVAFSTIIVEIGARAMVLSRGIRDRLREEGRQEGLNEGLQEGRQEGLQEGRDEGRAEGLQQANRQWEAWNRRREQAAAEGRPFDEPPPSGSSEPNA